MNFHESQNDMRQAYLGGATGALSSGLVWCLAGVIGVYFSPVNSMLTLFIGGMFIFPLSILFSKLLGSSGKHSQNNLLKNLAIENLGILFGGLFIAFVAAQYNHAIFYPIMLVIIGCRYLTFQTLYGLKIYWIFGAILMASGMFIAALSLSFVVGAFVGGIIEIIFAMIIYK